MLVTNVFNTEILNGKKIYFYRFDLLLYIHVVALSLLLFCAVAVSLTLAKVRR